MKVISPFEIVVDALASLYRGLVHLSGIASEARAAAHAQFQSYQALSHTGEVVLDGATADVLHSGETHSRNGDNYVLTLFVVTPQGRYFLFKSNESGKPFVRELTAERARLVLKRRFRSYRQPS